MLFTPIGGHSAILKKKKIKRKSLRQIQLAVHCMQLVGKLTFSLCLFPMVNDALLKLLKYSFLFMICGMRKISAFFQTGYSLENNFIKT